MSQQQPADLFEEFKMFLKNEQPKKEVQQPVQQIHKPDENSDLINYLQRNDDTQSYLQQIQQQLNVIEKKVRKMRSEKKEKEKQQTRQPKTNYKKQQEEPDIQPIVTKEAQIVRKPMTSDTRARREVDMNIFSSLKR